MLSATQSMWRASEVSNALWSRSPITAEEWGTSLLCHAHRTPLSVRQSYSPNKCPHPAVSHSGCWEKVSDNLTDEMRHLHQIINTLTDRRQSVLREPFPTPNISFKDETCMPLLSVPLSRNTLPIHFPCRQYRNQLQNESQACNDRFWKWIWKIKTLSKIYINTISICIEFFTLLWLWPPT